MKKLALSAIVGALAALLAGCESGVSLEHVGRVADAAMSGRPAAASSAGTSAAANTGRSDYGPGTAGDMHYVQAEDWFVSDQPLGTRTWVRVKLAKQLTAPTAETQNEGKFMRIGDGAELWTRNSWKTRIASTADLVLGRLVIAFDHGGPGGVYIAPASLEDSQKGDWFMAKVTDTSQLHRGYVMVSGGYKVDVANLRVILE